MQRAFLGTACGVSALLALSIIQAEPLPCEGYVGGIPEWITITPRDGFPCEVDIVTSDDNDSGLAYLERHLDPALAAMSYQGYVVAELNSLSIDDDWAFLAIDMQEATHTSEFVMAFTRDTSAASGWALQTSVFDGIDWGLVDHHPLADLDGVHVRVAWSQGRSGFTATVNGSSVEHMFSEVTVDTLKRPVTARVGLVYPLMDPNDGAGVFLDHSLEQYLKSR
ncbi:MAG: hypothetical protein DHS20C11_11680 [Lysobacteraceae bacterium]|nr:MAG: hypothetical protein DHS20C11_11680 [Xanthomonadaceae bacterium]